MSNHEPFAFRSLAELQAAILRLPVDVPLTEDFSPLAAPVSVGAHVAPNAFAVLPMEGCDCLPQGGPSALARRRYLRLAAGGAGLLWWEACAVVEEGRANPLQMMITEANAGAFAQLLREVNETAKTAWGHRPLHVLQLTHSGRYARPGKAAPMVPQRDPILDPRVGLRGDEPLVTDAYLDSLPERYAQAARLAQGAGFDGVDIKACHRYLVSELLAAHQRPGRYGGSFENRTRLLLAALDAVRKACGPEFLLACRFNVFDAHTPGYAFGTGSSLWDFDPAEPLGLVARLLEAGVGLLSNSAGNPYYIYPQVTRPFDHSSEGIPTPAEHPLESVARLFAFTRLVQEAAGPVPVVGNGYTWLRQFLPHAGSANLARKACAFVGLGRCAFAYPDAPRDILRTGAMRPEKCCVTCSKCTQIMRDHGRTGCVIRDGEIYAQEYKTARAGR
jgi:2,4-dienoyl-CoA reductase-like NADH-dependent reductase (Old Yellow Enzyme family)